MGFIEVESSGKTLSRYFHWLHSVVLGCPTHEMADTDLSIPLREDLKPNESTGMLS